MLRRNFLKSLLGLPFLGFLKPETRSGTRYVKEPELTEEKLLQAYKDLPDSATYITGYSGRIWVHDFEHGIRGWIIHENGKYVMVRPAGYIDGKEVTPEEWQEHIWG